MKGITTIFSHKKWVFAYTIFCTLVYLLKDESIEGAQFMLGILALIPMVIGANSFDKSQWRTKE